MSLTFATGPAARTLVWVGAFGLIGCSEGAFVPESIDTAPRLASIPADLHAPTEILVDASRDGGLWWFPQTGLGDPSLPHQGKALADYLRSQGLIVTETPRSTTLTCEQLGQYDLIIARPSGHYISPELDAYQRYLSRGGRLILLEDHSPTSNLTTSFGLVATGSHFATLTVFAPHPITAGVTSLLFGAGSAIQAPPPAFQTLASLSGHAVMGLLPVGLGELFFLGDTNGIQTVPQPFVDNLFAFMLLGARPVPACPILSPEDIGPQVAVLDLNEGERRSLMAKLEAASRSLGRGNAVAAIHQLDAFVNEIRALLRSGRLEERDATLLILLADELLESLV